MDFLKSNLWEIRKSPSLIFFGALLSASSLIIFFNWHQQGDLPLVYHRAPYPMCWGFLEDCAWVRGFSPQVMDLIFWTFGISAFSAIAFFLVLRSPGIGWFFLGLAWLTKWVLYVQDQRLASNTHYLLSWLIFAFLFIPKKTRLARWLITGFFIAQAAMKLSPEWLSGQLYTEQLGIPVKLGEWLAGISVLVEFLAPMALWFRELRYFATAYVALVAYQGLQWYALGYFDPLILLLLTLLFPITYWEERKTERESLYQSFLRPEPSGFWLAIPMAIFVLAQALPFLPSLGFKLNPVVANTLSLDQEASGVECRQTNFLVFADRFEEVDIPVPKGRSARYHCHPQLRFVDIKRACEQYSTRSGFRTIMSIMSSRRLGQVDFSTDFANQDLCRKDLGYKDLLASKGGGTSNGL